MNHGTPDEPIAVTGCSGFLGSEICRQLLDRGDRVLGLSRREVPALVQAGLQHEPGDLCDAEYVNAALSGVSTVIHTAAVAGVWGPWKHFYLSNVVATRNVLAACQSHSIDRLIFTSSPSVTFDGKHQRSVDERQPYPDRWLCHYPRTKAIAEREVIAADARDGLRTLSLRPHLIWGEDDPHLLPRVLQRARSGRLRVVGSGKNCVDTVHVVNAAAAHVDAIDAMRRDPNGCCGRSYFIAQDEPVPCWDWIGQLCEIHGVPAPRKAIPLPFAYAVGAILEAAYCVLRREDEPPMTRFVAAQLGRDHYFDTSASRERLGYRVRVTMEEGLRRLRACHENATESPHSE